MLVFPALCRLGVVLSRETAKPCYVNDFRARLTATKTADFLEAHMEVSCDQEPSASESSFGTVGSKEVRRKADPKSALSVKSGSYGRSCVNAETFARLMLRVKNSIVE